MSLFEQRSMKNLQIGDGIIVPVIIILEYTVYVYWIKWLSIFLVAFPTNIESWPIACSAFSDTQQALYIFYMRLRKQNTSDFIRDKFCRVNNLRIKLFLKTRYSRNRSSYNNKTALLKFLNNKTFFHIRISPYKRDEKS